MATTVKRKRRGKLLVREIVYNRRGSAVLDARLVNDQASITAAATEWLHELELAELSPLTISKYTQCLKAYCEWLAEPITQDSAKRFIHDLKQRGFKDSTRICYYHALKPFLAYLDIPLHIKFKKQPCRAICHSPEQIAAILSVAKKGKGRWGKLAERDSLIILLLAYTGCRRAEVTALRLRDINFYSKKINVLGKGKKARTVPIASGLYDALEKYCKNLQPGDLLFPVQPRRITAIIKRYATMAGIPEIHPHSFRHFFATDLIRHGVSIHAIQRLLGHADISTTAIYLDLADKDLDDAVSKLSDITE